MVALLWVEVWLGWCWLLFAFDSGDAAARRMASSEVRSAAGVGGWRAGSRPAVSQELAISWSPTLSA